MLISAAFLATMLGQPPAAKPFELQNGDRIVWLGNTLVEREQRYGYWEAALHAAFPKANFRVRNLGWSGDTVHGEARGRFDFGNAQKCFQQVVEPTLELKPTVIFISYGTNESFEGKDGLPKFEKGLEKLLDALKPANARIVLFSPIPIEIGRIPDAENRNRDLDLYSKAIGRVANNRSLHFADLNHEVWKLYVVADKMNGDTRREKDWWYTDNGMHLRDSGYDRTAHLMIKALGLDDTHNTYAPTELRLAIVAKNEQFFNKWRPQNETYLFGFRKHEQGKNAKEMAEFDPFIEKAEDEIDKLRLNLKK